MQSSYSTSPSDHTSADARTTSRPAAAETEPDARPGTERRAEKPEAHAEEPALQPPFALESRPEPQLDAKGEWSSDVAASARFSSSGDADGSDLTRLCSCSRPEPTELAAGRETAGRFSAARSREKLRSGRSDASLATSCSSSSSSWRSPLLALAAAASAAALLTDRISGGAYCGVQAYRSAWRASPSSSTA